jgi:hypothetical protein
MIYSARTKEEEIFQGLLNQQAKGAHGFICMEKEDDIVWQGCENVNNLGMYNQKESKMRRIINLHKKYQMDGMCILEHRINFSMPPERKYAYDIFSRMMGSWVSASHNINKSIS